MKYHCNWMLPQSLWQPPVTSRSALKRRSLRPACPDSDCCDIGQCHFVDTRFWSCALLLLSHPQTTTLYNRIENLRRELHSASQEACEAKDSDSPLKSSPPPPENILAPTEMQQPIAEQAQARALPQEQTGRFSSAVLSSSCCLRSVQRSDFLAPRCGAPPPFQTLTWRLLAWFGAERRIERGKSKVRWRGDWRRSRN